MSNIKGIDLEVTVGSIPNAGTKDPLYIGIYGKNGGREFAFNIPPGNILNANQVVRFRFGEGCCISDKDIIVLKECNSPKLETINLDDIEYVYIRKISRLNAGSNDSGNNWTDDDLLQLHKAVVSICDTTGNIRRFKKTTRMFFAYECGLQHWLTETQRPGCMIRIDFTTVHYGGDDIGNDISYNLTSIFNGITQTQSIPEHHLNHGHTEPIYNRTILYFIPGCCNFIGQLKLNAEVTEHDVVGPWWAQVRQDDIGHEDEEYNIECGKDAVNFSIVVKVIERRNTAVFTFNGTITSYCVG